MVSKEVQMEGHGAWIDDDGGEGGLDAWVKPKKDQQYGDQAGKFK